MARGVPDEEVAAPNVTPEDFPRKVVPYMEEPPNVVGGFADAATATAKKYTADSASWAGDQIAQFRTQAIQQLQQAKDNAPTGDPGEFAANFKAQIDKAGATMVQKAQGNPVASTMLQKGISDLSDTLFEHNLQWEAQQRVAARFDSIQTNLKTQAAVVEAHPELAQSVGSTLMDQINTAGGDPSTRLRLARAVNEQLSQSAAAGMTRQNPAGMLAALKDPENAPANLKSVLSSLNDEQREAIQSHATAQYSNQVSDGVVNTYRNQGPIAGAQALSAIDKLHQTDEVKASIRSDVERGLQQWHAEARQTHQQDIMGLEERLGEGKPLPSDSGLALSLWRNGAFTGEQAGEYRGRIGRAMESQAGDQADLSAYLDAYKNGKPLDPKDKDVKTGVAALFSQLTKNVQPGSAEWTNRGADIASRTGVVPEPVLSWARANLVSGDPQSAAQGAQAISRMEEASPLGIGYALEDKEKAQAKMINDMTQAGTPAQQAVETARKINDLPDAALKRLDETYNANQHAFASSAPTALRSELKTFKSWGLGSLPNIPPAMEGEFEQLQQSYYKATGGNIAQARDLAAHDLRQSWGVTQVNGQREFMQYAPEAMFPGLTTKMIRDDIASSVTAAGPYDPSKVRLTPTTDTATTQGRVWGLSVPDQFGAYDVIRGPDNKPIRYQIPDATDAVRAERDRLAKEGLAKAKALQESDYIAHKAEYDAFSGAQEKGGRAPVPGF
jgi:hypothetical protein